jgi:Uma2 family endonuclease
MIAVAESVSGTNTEGTKNSGSRADPMSTTDRKTEVALPWLVDGQRLDRATFHQRYLAMPEPTRAELIGGVVYMASPLGMNHGRLHVAPIVWLSYYAELTRGVEVLDNASVFLDEDSELQPDLVLRILPDCGGRTQDDGDYYANGPELVIEISDTSLAKDLGPKLADYERAGVPEYIVLGVDPPAVRWHVLRDGQFVEIPPDPEGIYRSKVFPGLWLDPAALLAGNTRALRMIVDQGVATPEHVDFVDRLAKAGGAERG